MEQKNTKKREDRVDLAKDRLKELKSRVSDMRRKGHDMSIPGMLLNNIPPKISMAEVTQDEKDFKKIEELFLKIEEDLSGAESIKSNKNQEIDEINELINRANVLLDRGSKDKAKKNFIKINTLYQGLGEQERKNLYAKCAELRKRLE